MPPPRIRRRVPRGRVVPVVADSTDEGEPPDNALLAPVAPPTGALITPAPERASEDGLEEYLHRVTFDADDMSMIFGELHDDIQQAWMPSNQDELMAARFKHMDLTTRRDEENHLREPLPGSLERPCMRGAGCAVMTIPGVDNPAPLVRHNTVRERAAHAERGIPLPESLCVMCKRHAIMRFYITAAAEAPLPDEPGGGNELRVFHSHANYADVPGEYVLEQCVDIGETHTHGMITPCVMHVAAWYRPERGADGVMRYFQDGYLVPSGSDF